MGLITCIDCGREISDRAQFCVGCGGPVVQHHQALPTAQPETMSEFGCLKCGLSDRTELAKSVLLQERILSESTGTLELNGTIQGRQQGGIFDLFGTSWSAGIGLDGVMQTSGSHVSALAQEWVSVLPPPENSKAYSKGLRSFEDSLYCRRCARFMIGGIARLLPEAVVACFGPKYVFDSKFKVLDGSIGPGMLGRHQSGGQPVKGIRYIQQGVDAMKEFKSAKRELDRLGFQGRQTIVGKSTLTGEQFQVSKMMGSGVLGGVLFVGVLTSPKSSYIRVSGTLSSGPLLGLLTTRRMSGPAGHVLRAIGL